MAPVAGETASERAAKYARKAAELAAKGTLNRIYDTLKKRPDVVASVEAFLIQRGIMQPLNGDGRVDLIGDFKKEDEGDSDPKVSTDSPNSASFPPAEMAQPVGGEHDLLGQWDRNVSNYAGVPVALNTQALQIAEPAIFNKQNMKLIIKRGGLHCF